MISKALWGGLESRGRLSIGLQVSNLPYNGLPIHLRYSESL